MFRTTLVIAVGIACGTFAAGGRAEEQALAIRWDFPGGNVVVESAGNVDETGKCVVQMKPDLDGGRDWFYWCFEATAAKPVEATFEFPEKVAGQINGAVGFQGPAISQDGGQTWDWMGNDTAVVRGRSFRYTFAKAGESVRLAVTIPYLQRDFDAFKARHAENPHFRTSVMTHSRRDRAVELVQIGRPGPDVTAVLMTARHHACETIASFVLEGILQAAMAETPAGEAFRKKYVLYAVPFVDKDGVEEGDQGKGRTPHDHNRDYGAGAIYPEVRAIMELGESANVRASLDLHCPMLNLADHQVLYFVGPKDYPPHNEANVKRFADAIKQKLPAGSPFGPLVWLKDADADRWKHNSGHFARRPGALMAATLEIPYAPAKAIMHPEAVRSYGEAILRAWNETSFASSPSP
ncbi:MAG TPA: M14 family zinc carboxypeptidase [Pirellulaceae bacterium]|jgi:hypothetical protein|nr:M14 family zinc carboxypeptidase [Pirellulaceae bacterium]